MASANGSAALSGPPDPVNDLEQLLAGCAGGCQRSFSRLYQLTHRRLFAIVLRFVRQRAQAEEVLQDIYIKVWLRSKQFDAGRGMAVQWLATVARRAAIDSLRSSAVRPVESRTLDDEESPYDRLPSGLDTPVECYASKQRNEQIRLQLDTLSEPYRESLLLAFFDELTHQEISEVLGCPLGTIKSRVRRGLHSLRPALEPIQ